MRLDVYMRTYAFIITHLQDGNFIVAKLFTIYHYDDHQTQYIPFIKTMFRI